VAERISVALSDEANWTTVHSRFASERAISEYINSFPHLLEDGLRPYPTAKTREFAFSDKRRSDVLLLDRQGRLVFVECKQNAPCDADVNQLRHYMAMARKEILGPKTETAIRGVLVHGGSRKIPDAVMQLAMSDPNIEIGRFAVSVDFASSV
jgi:RecB family endonuclease NucS